MSPTDDLDDLIRELAAPHGPHRPMPPRETRLPRHRRSKPRCWCRPHRMCFNPPARRPRARPARTRPGSRRLARWLEVLREHRASDLLLVAGAPAAIRVDGQVRPLGDTPLDGETIEDAVVAVLPPHAARQYRETGIADASYRLQGIGRFRINLHHERGRAAAAIRALPTEVPRLATLHLPAGVEQLSRLTRGLVLIGGPTGSGKSTTLAALVEEINRREPRHIVTIEDPDRVRAHPSPQPGRAGRDRGRRAGLPDGAARRAATGAGRDRGGRDARSGNDAHRAGRGRDRPSRALERAHDRCGVDRLARLPTPFRWSGRTPSGRSCRWRSRRC